MKCETRLPRGLLQTYSSVNKNFIEKRRNKCGCCCEFFSHLILFVLLLFGYRLSKVLTYPTAYYDILDLKIPPFQIVPTNSSSSNSNAPATPLGTSTNVKGIFPFITSLLNGPLLIPPFDAYVYVARYVTAASKGSAAAELALQTSQGVSFGNLIRFSSTIYFAPNTPLTHELIDYMNRTTQTFNTIDVTVWDTEGAAIKKIVRSGAPFALIVVNEASSAKANVDIRMDYRVVPNTNLIIDDTVVGFNAGYQKYFLSGFLSLQLTIDEWLSHKTGAADGSPPQCSTTLPLNPVEMAFPTVSYDVNAFYTSVGFLLGLAMTMALLYPMSRLTKSIVEEKESRMREIQKIMGLYDWSHQLSWFITAFITFLWIAISCTYVTKVTFLSHSNTFLLFIYFFLFCMSLISVSFFISVFFSNSKLAAIFAPVFLFITLLPRFAFLNTNENEVWESKYIASLLPGTAFSFGADILANYEYTGVGIQFDNINTGLFNFAGVLQFLVLDIFLYGFLAWYLDQVYPHEFGNHKHPLFLFHYKYWFPSLDRSLHYEVNQPENIPELGSPEDINKNDNIELIPSSLKQFAQVLIAGLSKRYADGKVAVRKVDMALLENQITCLLGHNGAGKTSTISVLTGMLDATEGEVVIYGKSLSRDLAAIRQQIGICPQHNVLFPLLTVKEHLRYFGNIKGLYGRALNEAVTKSVESVGLTEKIDVLSSALSGGMKRKLSLAIALIGDNKFVLLDEPTSGMDPYSRRSTWEMLQKSREHRVILLTTHFMDEADILGDRIVIMSEGEVRCSGSSLFLKTRFGAGYLLSLAKTNAHSDVDAITKNVQSIIPESVLASSVAGEVIYQLPLLAISRFAELFNMLGSKSASLGVGSCGISITSLEQVFIHLVKESRNEQHRHIDTDGEEIEEEGKHVPQSWLQASLAFSHDVFWRFFHRILPCVLPVKNRKISATDESPPHIGFKLPSDQQEDTGKPKPIVSLVAIQLYELMRKRWVIAKRDIKGFLFGVIFPALQILAVLAILTIVINPAGAAIPMNAGIFKSEQVTPLVYEAGKPQSTWPGQSLSGSTMNLKPRSNPTAYNLSRNMIEEYYSKGTPGNGGYVFRDLINTRLDVDWPSVKTLLNQLLSDGAVINSTLPAYTGFTISLGSLVAVPGFDPSSAILNGLNSLPNNTAITVGGTPISFGSNSTGETTVTFPGGSFQVNNVLLSNSFAGITPNSSIASILNATATGTNNTVNQTTATTFLTNLFGANALNASLTNLSVSVDSVVYISGTQSVQLTGVTLHLLNTDAVIGNVIIPVATLIRFLPNTINQYNVQLPSRYTIMHNTSSPHGFAAFRGELLQTAYRLCLNNPAFSYEVRNHPLPLSARQTIQIKIIIALFTSIFILIPLCYIPSNFIVFIVKERVCKSQHLQYVSSVSPYLYWLSVYLWDMAQYSILVLLTICFFFIYGRESSQVFVDTTESTLAVFCLLFFYGSSGIPLSYLYSLGFENYSTAQISIMTINFFTGFVFVLAYFVMSSIPLTADLAKQMVEFFRLFPGYNVGEGLINVSTAFLRIQYLGVQVKYFDWEVTGRNLTYLGLESVVYFGLVLLSEFSLFRRAVYLSDIYRARMAGKCPPPLRTPDADVMYEQEVVETSDPNAYSLFLNKIDKTFPPTVFGSKAKYAVREVSLACPPGERFGLLGINGAGKTTTLGILTGDLQPTDGVAYVAGLPLTDPNTRRYIGFCPQVDPLLELMTGQETLWFFGRIRGIERKDLQRRVDALIADVGLLPFAHKPCGTYSGGNKRKLSLAVALIGDPKILLLDEPSTGMDPQARRDMWDLIARVSESRSVVLTTHSMEECEALCTRVGIMVSGRMQCLGSSQHLKSRFGTGYQIEIRYQEGRGESTLEFCHANIEGVTVDEVHGSFLRLTAPADLDLELTFRVFEANKESLGILNYSVSQATLEQVFIKFAKEQEEEKGQHHDEQEDIVAS